MKKYKIIKPIVLGFLTRNDSYDAILHEGIIHFDGRNIVYTGLSGISSVSHTQNHAIELYLEMGCIEEIK